MPKKLIKQVDPETGEEREVEVEVEEPSTAKAVADVAASFKAALEEVRNSVKPAGPVAPDPEAARQAQATRAAEVMKQYDALCAEGKFAEGAQLLAQFSGEANAQAARGQDVTKTPGYKGLVAAAKRGAQADHAEVFKLYGPEVEAEIASMEPGDRVDPAMWDEAVRRTKMRHLDEIIKAQVDAQTQERTRDFVPGAPGSRGRMNRPTQDLDEEELVVAEFLGFSAEEYSRAKKDNEASRIKRGFTRGMVSVLPPGNPAPGRF